MNIKKYCRTFAHSLLNPLVKALELTLKLFINYTFHYQKKV